MRQPTPIRAAACRGQMSPPDAASAARHAATDVRKETPNAPAAIASQRGSAPASAANAADTFEPRSCGIVATATTAARATTENAIFDESFMCGRIRGRLRRAAVSEETVNLVRRRRAVPASSAVTLPSMRGAVAAGHPLTAEAGSRVLAAGGNAVDACVTAAFASWVVESPLTGPGAGGFMLVHRARDRTTRLLDFFVATPGLGLKRARGGEMHAIDIAFDSETKQIFRIGPAACAVPGAVAGLEAAHRAFGSHPWSELVAPAAELAREGVELTKPQAHLHAILDLILRHTDEGRRLYGRGGARLAAGDVLEMGDLADTLDLIASNGARALHRGDLARATVAAVRDGGGELTLQDLTSYRPVWRRPVRTPFAGCEFVSNPPPSSGGILIAYGLSLLDRIGPTGAPATAEALAAAVARIEARRPGAVERAAPGGTTHISVLDARGNAASLSSSTGSGSGVIVPGTGIHLNNML